MDHSPENRKNWPHIAGRYGAAVAIVLFAALLTWACGPLLRLTPIALFFGAVAASAWVGGFGPGLFASVLSYVLIQEYFLKEGHLSAGSPESIVSGVIFFLVTLVTSLGAGRERKAKEWAREAESELQQVLDSMNEVFFAVDGNWQIVHANRPFREIETNVGRNLMGQDLWEAFPALKGSVFEEKYRLARETKTAQIFEAQSVLSGKWFEVRVFPSASGISVFAADINEAKVAEAKRQESEERFRVMADQAPVLLWMTGRDNQLEWFNLPWLNFTGRALAQESGEGWLQGLHPEDLQGVREEREDCYARRAPFTMEYRLRRFDGEYRWILDNGIPRYSAHGVFVGFIGSCIDITEMKLLAEERGQLLRAERVAREQAERSSVLKDEFLATLSHELRTPLNAILGWSQLLSEGDSSEAELKEGFETIERNARLQVALVNDLLDMSRITTGKLRLELQEVDLREVVEAAVTSAHPTARAKNIEMRTSLPGATCSVSADPARLQQVVWNLLSNALKFTPASGKVDVEVTLEAERVLLKVQDNGQGILPEFLPHVFDRFRQEDASYTRRVGGLGLGLALVKQLVDMHGGEVHARSDGKDQGACLEVELPLLRREEVSSTDKPVLQEPAELVPERSPAPPPMTELDGVQILVVDDEVDTRLLLQSILTSNGAQVTLASSVAEAVDSMQAEQPQLVLSDVAMPHADGYALVRGIREGRFGNTPQMPCVALTAYAHETDRQRALEAGFDRHVAKPVDAGQLVHLLQQTLHSHAVQSIDT